MTSVRSGESVGRSDIASKWPWLLAGDFDQRLLVDDRRSAQQRAGDVNFVFTREEPDQSASARRQTRSRSARSGARQAGMREQTGQNAVEQLDMIGAAFRRTLQVQLSGSAARGFGAALGDRRLCTISSSSGISAVAVVMKLP